MIKLRSLFNPRNGNILASCFGSNPVETTVADILMKNPFCNPLPIHKCYRCNKELTHENVKIQSFHDLTDFATYYHFDNNYNLIDRTINHEDILFIDRIIEDYNEIEEIVSGATLIVQCECGMKFEIPIDSEKFFDSHEFYHHIELLLNQFSFPPIGE